MSKDDIALEFLEGYGAVKLGRCPDLSSMDGYDARMELARLAAAKAKTNA